MPHEIPTAEDLRVEVARRQLKLYLLAARVGFHPARLGQVLNGRAKLTAELAQRITAALREADPA